jgi:hypothetical protein
VSVTLEQNDWTGHSLTTGVAKLLLEEVLGFTVTVVERPMGWSDPNNNSLSRLRDGFVDANLEAWTSDWPAAVAANRSHVTSVAYRDLQGRVGIYVPTWLVSAPYTNLFMGYWRPYQTRRDVIDVFRWDNTHAEVLRNWSRGWASNCEDGVYACAPGSAQWQPPHCNASGASCVPLFHANSQYTFGWVQELVRYHELNFTVYYAGEVGAHSLYKTLAYADAVGQPAIFYLWEPHPVLASGLCAPCPLSSGARHSCRTLPRYACGAPGRLCVHTCQRDATGTVQRPQCKGSVRASSIAPPAAGTRASLSPTTRASALAKGDCTATATPRTFSRSSATSRAAARSPPSFKRTS